jgi:hypothetical protein
MALRLLIAVLILAVPVELPGCGPFLPVTLFHLTVGPEAPAEFAHGQLGIVQPTYERLYQVIAYRYLSGVGLNDAERQAVLSAPQPTADTNPWLAARNQAPGITPLRQLDPYRQVNIEGYYLDTYLNCNDDAFRTAAATLERIQRTGAAAEWIAAQDMVFSNCSQGAAIPQPASDPRLRADRAYQIASAKFYSEQYDAARQDFQTIAADASSPWHDVAPYLAARCLIRAGKFAEAERNCEHRGRPCARALACARQSFAELRRSAPPSRRAHARTGARPGAAGFRSHHRPGSHRLPHVVRQRRRAAAQ